MPRIDYSDYVAMVEVDGTSVPISVITTHFQEDPFPGEHRYSLRLRGPQLGRFFGQPLHGIGTKPDRYLSQEIFVSLTTIASLIQERDQDWQPNRYVLNNIERITLTGGELVMEGVCSEVLRDPGSKPI